MNEKRAAQRGKTTCPSSHSLTLKADEVRYLPEGGGKDHERLFVSICKQLGPKLCLLPWRGGQTGVTGMCALGHGSLERVGTGFALGHCCPPVPAHGG